VLTVAGSAASPLLGGAVLFVYALGTAAPLFVIAYFWDRLNLGRQPWLRGRTLRLAGWTVHTTNLPAGILFVLLGTSFIVFQGSSALSGLYDDLGLAEVGFRLQSCIADHVDRTADVLLGLALALAVTLTWSVRRGKAGRREPVSETISSAPSPIAASDRE